MFMQPVERFKKSCGPTLGPGAIPQTPIPGLESQVMNFIGIKKSQKYSAHGCQFFALLLDCTCHVTYC